MSCENRQTKLHIILQFRFYHPQEQKRFTGGANEYEAMKILWKRLDKHTQCVF